MKKVCYTVITNDYDTLKDPLVVSKGWDYICFSDRELKSKVWKVVPFKGDNREVKIKGYNYFDGITLYVDGSFLIKKDLNDFIKDFPTDFSIAQHPQRSCIYQEAHRVVQKKIVNEKTLLFQIGRYRNEGFPFDMGLGANGVLLRDFSKPIVRDICDLWWEEFENGVPRDQISLSYCFWKLKMSPFYINVNSIRSYFKKRKHVE